MAPDHRESWLRFVNSENTLKSLKFERAKGRCLVEEMVPLSSADAILSFSILSDGVEGYEAGINPFANTIRASRLSVSVRDEGGFEELFRKTAYVYERHKPILAPTVILAPSGYAGNFVSGFQRSVIRSGALESSGAYDWKSVYERLGWGFMLDEKTSANS